MRPLLLLALLLVPLAMAQSEEARMPRDARLESGNQYLDLTWKPPTASENVSHYVVHVRGDDGESRINVSGTFYRHYGINGRTYELTVAAVYRDGTVGPASAPLRGVPRLPADLQYFEAGLVVTWLGLFGYAAFLARKEARVDRKLEQLRAHRPPRSK